MKALNTAAELHGEQKRKSDGLPYLVHPFTVTMLIWPHTEDETVVCAALLHDVLEDVKGYGEEEMRRDFGDRITDIVRELTEDKDPNVEDDKRATWKDRKIKYLDALRRDSDEAALIAAADKLSNLRALNDDIERNGLSVLDHFNAGAEEQKWFFREMLQILDGRSVDGLVKELADEYDRFVRFVK